MSNEYLGAIIASDIGDVCDGLFAGVNREFADIFGANAAEAAPRHTAKPEPIFVVSALTGECRISRENGNG